MSDAPEWISQIERTEYSDGIFSKIGRLLFKATNFESYCKTASSLILMKTNFEILCDSSAFDKFLVELDRIWLNNHVKNIKTILPLKEIKGYLTNAKNSRNILVHSLMLGIEHVFGKQDNEDAFEAEIEKLTKDIVTGEYYAVLISCVLTREIYPDTTYIDKEIKWVLEN